MFGMRMESVERHPDTVQLPLLVVGYALVLFYGRQLPRLTPPFESFPWDSITPQLYNWSTLQFGLAMMVLGLALSNRSVVHRFQVFRLSRTQRLGALGCAGVRLPGFKSQPVGSSSSLLACRSFHSLPLASRPTVVSTTYSVCKAAS